MQIPSSLNRGQAIPLPKPMHVVPASWFQPRYSQRLPNSAHCTPTPLRTRCLLSRARNTLCLNSQPRSSPQRSHLPHSSQSRSLPCRSNPYRLPTPLFVGGIAATPDVPRANPPRGPRYLPRRYRRPHTDPSSQPYLPMPLAPTLLCRGSADPYLPPCPISCYDPARPHNPAPLTSRPIPRRRSQRRPNPWLNEKRK